MRLDKSKHYGLLFVGTELTYVQDGIKFSPKTEESIDEEITQDEAKADEEVYEDLQAKGDGAKGFVCKKCGKICKSKFGLQAHMRHCNK